MSYESVGENFDLHKYLKARELAIQIVREVAMQITPGMTEADGHELIEAMLLKYNVEKKWHPTKFRIGKNTLKAFRETSAPNLVLGQEDIFFIDIGPVFDGHEADYGETFTIGGDILLQKLAQDCKLIFDDCCEQWKKTKLSGHELYHFAEKRSQELGLVLNLKMSGHRLGDFPHAIHSRSSLQALDVVPKERLWVLEILVRHSELPYGAFFEDIIF